MNRFDLEYEKTKWEHPYRIQVTKPLRWYELEAFIKNNTTTGAHYAIERRGGKFVLWRQPEVEWDVEKAAPEWLQEWTSQEPPPLEAFIKEFRTETEKETLVEDLRSRPSTTNKENNRFANRVPVSLEEIIMPKSENVLRRDEAIRTEYEQYKKQGFRTGHIYRVLADKYYLSPLRIRDIVTLTKNKLPNMPK
jgi:hypothetical protein